MKEQITYDTFDKVDIRIGTVISVKKNEKARKPSLIIEVYFGNEIGAWCNELVINLPQSSSSSFLLGLGIKDLEELGSVMVHGERAILSLVGEGMRTTPGTAGKMFSALAKEGINIEMITQGASEINISCVILQNQTSQALQAIHREFLENL